MSCGTYHAVALLANGTVAAWGENEFGQTNVPPGLAGVIAVAAGADHCLALQYTGTVVAWGGNRMGQCSVPPQVRYAYAVAAASQRSEALIQDEPPRGTIRPTALAYAEDTLVIEIPTLRGEAYLLEAKRAVDAPGWRLIRGVEALGSRVVLNAPAAVELEGYYCVRPRLR